MSTVIINTGISTTQKSAQSKKCRLLKKVRDGAMNPKVAIAIRNVDELLAVELTEAEIWSAHAGEKPSRGSGRGSIKIEVEL